MTVRDDLLRAYALIQDETAWATGATAFQPEKGLMTGRILWFSCRPTSPKAKQWCAKGAIIRFTRNSGGDALRATNNVAHDLFGVKRSGALTTVNDTFGHRAALMVLRHAILKEEGLA